MFKRVRMALISVLLLCSGSALAYDGFTVGAHAEIHSWHTGGYGVHLVAPLFSFRHGTEPTMVSLRGDFSASAAPFVGLSAVLSGTGANMQPFAAFGGGVDFGGGRPTGQFLSVIGVRARMFHNFFLYTQGHLRIGEEAMVGLALGLEYSF